jgi:hypothetical protein
VVTTGDSSRLAQATSGKGVRPLSPWTIVAIVAAALVILHIEHDRTT